MQKDQLEALSSVHADAVKQYQLHEEASVILEVCCIPRLAQVSYSIDGLHIQLSKPVTSSNASHYNALLHAWTHQCLPV